MLELYPVSQRIKEVSFLRILRNILALQALLLSVVILIKGDPLAAVISLLAGIVFSIYFVYFYSKRRLRS
jgi:ABC-2 type transport system permease protein